MGVGSVVEEEMCGSVLGGDGSSVSGCRPFREINEEENGRMHGRLVAGTAWRDDAGLRGVRIVRVLRVRRAGDANELRVRTRSGLVAVAIVVM
jgi:hypothetical protein